MRFINDTSVFGRRESRPQSEFNTTDHLGSLAVGLPSQPYDWHRHWIREDFTTWLRSSLPSDNYQIDFTNLLPTNFYSTSGREFEVAFFIEDESEETIVAKQTFYRNGTKIESRGTWSNVVHANLNYRPQFKIRGSVIEMLGGVRDENGVACTYQWIPFWTGEPRSLSMRIKTNSDNPQLSSVYQTGLRHDADKRNMLCPANYTCSIIDDYAHPEWRVYSHSLEG